MAEAGCGVVTDEIRDFIRSGFALPMAAMTAPPKLVSIGKILGAHGVKGLVKLASFTAEPEDVAAYGPVSDKAGKRKWTVTLQGWNKDHFLARIKGVETREQAEALRGTEIFVSRAMLPEAETGHYYYTDLIGIEARLEDGTVYGKVTNVVNYGAGDILEIQPKTGKKELISFANATVPKVNLAEGWLLVIPPELEPEKA